MPAPLSALSQIQLVGSSVDSSSEDTSQRNWTKQAPTGLGNNIAYCRLSKMSSARPSGYGSPKAASVGSPAVTLNNRVTVEGGGITDISRKVFFVFFY